MFEFNLGGFREEPDRAEHWSFEASLLPRLVGQAGDVDLRPFTSPRHNQRQTSSCVAQSVCKALEIKRIMEKGHDAHVDLSRLAVYWHARNLMVPNETKKDGGTYVSHAFDAIRRYGVPPEADWPWDPAKILEAPTWGAMRKAYVSKIQAFYKIKASGKDRIDSVVKALQAGNPVVYGCNVDSTWFNYGPKSDPLKPVAKSNRSGRHATVLIGWKDGLFIGENSWGNRWGLDGFYFLDPSVIAHPDSKDFWVPQVGWETYGE